MSLAEFALIDRIRARTLERDDILLGIGDDAALLQPRPNEQLVVTADTLNSGVHFPAETPAFDIGWKTLAVNLSDLAAMGARPAWCTLALSLPDASEDWIEAFADGFFALADQHDIALIGGDTTRGPLSLSVTAMGQVGRGQALRRDRAQVGDDIWVSGTLGDAAGALRLWQQGALNVATATLLADYESLRLRLLRPTPRVTSACACGRSRMQRWTCLMACWPTWATSPRAARWPRMSMPICCRFRMRCVSCWAVKPPANAHCAAVTTTNCASPPPLTSAMRCITSPNRWTCRSPVSAASPKGRACMWMAKPPMVVTSTSPEAWRGRIPLQRKGL